MRIGRWKGSAGVSLRSSKAKAKRPGKSSDGGGGPTQGPQRPTEGLDGGGRFRGWNRAHVWAPRLANGLSKWRWCVGVANGSASDIDKVIRVETACVLR